MAAAVIIQALCALAWTIPFSRALPPHLSFQAEPKVIIPGLTQTLTLTCGPGTLAHQYREVFLMEMFAHGSGGARSPLALLRPGQAPTLTFNDPRIKVSGSLDMANPVTDKLQLVVDRPSSTDAGTVECQVVGLGNDGNVLQESQTTIITVHPESEAVARQLRETVAALKREADGLEVQTQTLKQRNQQLAHQYQAKRAALSQKTAELSALKAKAASLLRTVGQTEQELNMTAQNLLQDIANVSALAPQARVAFNALENTEKVYTSGNQIKLETAVLNEGGGYNSSVSEFRAPVAGVYCFTSAQLVHDTLGSAAIRVFTIKRNGTIIGGAANADDHGSSGFKQSSTSTLYHLTPYDYVRVYQYYSSSANSGLAAYSDTPGGKSTNFAGYLLQ